MQSNNQIQKAGYSIACDSAEGAYPLLIWSVRRIPECLSVDIGISSRLRHEFFNAWN
jgi:hypothetical protein